MTSQDTKPAGPSEGTSQSEKAAAKPKKASTRTTKTAKGTEATPMTAAATPGSSTKAKAAGSATTAKPAAKKAAEAAKVEPTATATKKTTSERATKAKPEAPAKDAKATKAEAPVKAAKAEAPAKAAKAEAPAKAAKAEVPAKAAKAEVPAKAAKAQKPTTPAEQDSAALSATDAPIASEAGAAKVEPATRGGRKKKAPSTDETLQLPLDVVSAPVAEPSDDEGDEGDEGDEVVAEGDGDGEGEGKKKRRRRRRRKKKTEATPEANGEMAETTAPEMPVSPLPEEMAKSEPKQAAKSEPKQAAKSEPKQAAKSEPKPAPKSEPKPAKAAVPLHKAEDEIELPKPGQVIDLRGSRKGMPVVKPKRLEMRRKPGEDDNIVVPKPGDVLDLRPGRRAVAVTEAERNVEDERVAQLKETLSGSPDAPSAEEAQPERRGRDDRGPRRERDDRGGRGERDDRGGRGERDDRGGRGPRGDRDGRERDRKDRDRGEDRGPRPERAVEPAHEIEPAVIEQALLQGDSDRGRQRGGRKEEARVEPAATHAIDITVAIMARRRGPSTKRLMETIVRQDLPWEGELLIVDCGSGDNSIRSLGPNDAQVISLDETTPDGAARDRAVAEARGNLVVFIEQDATPESSRWLVNLTEALFEDERVGVVTGPVLSPDAPAPSGRGRTYHRHDTAPERLEIEGGNLAVRRSVALRIPMASYEGDLEQWVEAILDGGSTKRYEPGVALRRAPERTRAPEAKPPRPAAQEARPRPPEPTPAYTPPVQRETAEIAPVALGEPPRLWEVPLQIATQTLHSWSDVASGREPRSLSSLVLAPLKATRKVLGAYNRRSLIPIPKFLRED